MQQLCKLTQDHKIYLPGHPKFEPRLKFRWEGSLKRENVTGAR